MCLNYLYFNMIVIHSYQAKTKHCFFKPFVKQFAQLRAKCAKNGCRT